MFLRTFPPLFRRLQTDSSALELFEPMTSWFHTLEVLNAISAVLVLAGKTGNFQCRFGIQTATLSLNSINGATHAAAEASQLGTAGDMALIRFDPNGASDGNISTATSFRVGVMYSLSSGSTLAVGDVELRNLCWR